MRQLTVVVAFALAFGVVWNELSKGSSKPTSAGKATITDTKTPKRGATAARSSSKGSTAKVKNAQAKFPAGNSAKAVAEVAKADRNAAKAVVEVPKADLNAAKAVEVAKADRNAAKAVEAAKADLHVIRY